MQAPGQAPDTLHAKGFAIASLVCGSVALVASPTIALGPVLGLVAVVLGTLSIIRGQRAMAITGVALGAVGTVLSIVLLLVGWSYFGRFELVRVSRSAPDTSATVYTSRASVADRLLNGQPVVVANDSTLDFSVNRLSLDSEGNLVVYYTMELTGADDAAWIAAVSDTWTVNDTAVEPAFGTMLYQSDYEYHSWFYIPADQIEAIGGLERIYSIRGGVSVEAIRGGSVASSYEYQLAL